MDTGDESDDGGRGALPGAGDGDVGGPSAFASASARPPSVDEPTPDGPPGAAASDAAASPPSDATKIAAPSTGNGDAPPKKERWIIPETPRWRFIEVAKKSLGYSSLSAGTVVEGLSAEELAAKYVAPEWQVEEKSVEQVVVAATRMEEEPAKEEKEWRKVGRLDIQEKEGETEERDQRNVGRLNIREKEEEAQALITGTFAGFQKRADEDDSAPIEAAAYESIDERDSVQEEHGETLQPPLIAPAEDTPPTHYLKVQSEWQAEATSAPSTDARPEPEVNIADDTCSEMESDLEKQIDAVVPMVPTSHSDPMQSHSASIEDKAPEGLPKKKRWLLLLLLLVVVVALAAIIGVLASRGPGGDNEASRAFGGGAVLIDESDGADAPSSSPSFVSMLSPTPGPTENRPVCPADAKLLEVQHRNGLGGGANVGDPSRSYATTWAVRDACTGKEVMRCQPCPGYVPWQSDNGEASIAAAATNMTRFSAGRCVGPVEQPRHSRGGRQFQFDLLGANARCVDGQGSLIGSWGSPYEWGQFGSVDNSNDCADACVKDTPKELVRLDAFLGYEYDCKSQLCRCLYNEGTLNDHNSANFDATCCFAAIRHDADGESNKSSSGVGEIVGIASENAGYYCGKLVCTDQDCDENEADRPMHSPSEDRDARQLGLKEDDSVGEQVYRPSSSNDGASGCLSSDKDYFFEFKPSDDTGACCGFNPHSFAVTYDDILVAQGANIFDDGRGRSFERNGGRRYFGQRSGVCPSPYPSSVPSIAPVPIPTSLPSENPSPNPTESPSEHPTNSNSPSDRPSLQPSNWPTQSPHPSNQPTNSPTHRPSNRPTTRSPTAKPTCDEEYEDFNICFALDMSGSLCNSKTGFLCYNCKPDSVCHDTGFEMGTCCENFFDVVEFAKLMVNTLEVIPSDQAYTVVGFATDATLASGPMSSPEEALEALNELTYSGGKTNHAAAFTMCRESGARFRRKDVILLITDGDPSEPDGTHRADAIEAAAEAKAEGMSIIPVMIIPEIVTALNADTVTYLKEISSDGSIFVASHYSVLSTIEESLLDQVSCNVR